MNEAEAARFAAEVERESNKEIHNMVITWEDALADRENKGEAKGRQEGEAAVLLRQITLKFGPPTKTLKARLESADPDQLLEWAERLLGAETLEDVFGTAH